MSLHGKKKPSHNAHIAKHPISKAVTHSVVKDGIASKFLCNVYTKVASEISSHPQLNPKFSRFLRYFSKFFLHLFFPLFCSKMTC